MKWFLILWAVPMLLLGSWYSLSFYDMNFGYRILSRELHDLVFVIYGNLLGVPAEDVPGLVLKAILVDSALVAGIVVVRYQRRRIMAFIRSMFAAEAPMDQPAEDARSTAPSLSRAP
ncbi:hypothetical protein DFR52_101962 [Hoeflea marina]|uniref:Uncharacterized protein n=1 Tax=Hoeflea marina TaxID=274592 RepID=A0A317PTK2_9HYPH|nr:DUF6105 family protein [Hoeflea marina]PWW04267.1 hypothetical protein DFR52_101962 [Hoeflea marina]